MGREPFIQATTAVWLIPSRRAVARTPRSRINASSCSRIGRGPSCMHVRAPRPAAGVRDAVTLCGLARALVPLAVAPG